VPYPLTFVHPQVLGRTAFVRKRSGGPWDRQYARGSSRFATPIGRRRFREVVAIPIAFARGTEPRRSPSASEHSALFDGKGLDLVVGEDDAIGDRLADQSERDGRDIGD